MTKHLVLGLAVICFAVLCGCDSGETKIEKVSTPAKQDSGSSMQQVQNNPNIPDAAKKGMGLK